MKKLIRKPTFSNLKRTKTVFYLLMACSFTVLLLAVKTLNGQTVELLKDINTKTFSSVTERFTTVGSQVFFVAVDPVLGRCLYKTDHQWYCFSKGLCARRL